MLFFFFNNTATTEIYPLSLHDALPICADRSQWCWQVHAAAPPLGRAPAVGWRSPQRRRSSVDRKSTRLDSSHSQISYAVLCLKKKKACNASRRALAARDVREAALTGHS